MSLDAPANSLPSVLAFNPGHDGAIAYLREQQLIFSLEAEKDSQPRHTRVGPELLIDAMRRIDGVPDVFCIGGWSSNRASSSPVARSGYEGVENHHATFTETTLFGKRIMLFRSTHERSHLFCSYGLSPYPEGEPCYALLWEGRIGAFYEITRTFDIIRLGEVLRAPGYKYSFLFDLADPTCATGGWRHDVAGKLMALGAYSSRGATSPEEEDVIRQILQSVLPPTASKEEFAGSKYLNCGVTDSRFLELVGKFSDRLFDTFYQYAKQHLTKGLPLIISGGCGLNCEWNTLWRNSKLFADVFVPPVTNDSGSAIGTAIEAQYVMTSRAKIDWNVYSGLDFVWEEDSVGFTESDLDVDYLARLLHLDRVVAWVQGKYEIGPRALGHRSLIAAPFNPSVRDRLNHLKGREDYRPIAPICLEEEAHRCFGVPTSSPHMLYLFQVRMPELRAVTHVDGSARVQTVSKQQSVPMYELLCAFKRQTGFGVLCNTSLNFPRRGFVNRSSDLFAYAGCTGIDAVVVGNRLYERST